MKIINKQIQGEELFVGIDLHKRNIQRIGGSRPLGSERARVGKSSGIYICLVKI